MIDPTDEMVTTFLEAWEDAGAAPSPHDRTRTALAAILPLLQNALVADPMFDPRALYRPGSADRAIAWDALEEGAW